MKNTLLISILVSCVAAGYGQDPQLSQSYAAPLYLNPALTGNTYLGRVVANYRNQWPGIPKGWVTYAASWDHNIRKQNSGVGLSIMQDVAGTNALRFTNIGASYAYAINMNRFTGLRLGLRFSYTNRTYDKSGMLFADQVVRDNAPVTIENGLMDRTGYLDFGTGAVFYGKNFWLGTTFLHLNRPNQTLFDNSEAKLPIKYSVHGGANIPVERTKKGKVKSKVIATFNYKMEQEWDQLDIGGYFGYYPLSIGVWYRGIPGLKSYRPGYQNNDAVIIVAQYVIQEKFSFSYSHDFTISRLAANSGGAHEIALVIEYPFKHRQKKRMFIVPCAKF